MTQGGRGGVHGAAVLLLALGLTTAAVGAAHADGPVGTSPFAFDGYEDRYGRIPEELQYVRDPERKPPSVSFRRNQLRAVEAPTRYRTSSILKYTTPLGDSGMELRVKLPLKRRKIVKLELRF